MPQVDLETLVSVCGGSGKIACETLATTAINGDQPSEVPPDSFWLSKDAELDWLDRNAFLDRRDSTKASSISTNLNPNIHSNANPSNSQRFSNLKTKASIFGLPKPQKSCFVEAKNRRNCRTGARLFPKRSGSSGKSDSSMVEPSSPKVSCIGRVRSKRDRNRRLKNRQRSGKKKEKTESAKKTGGLFASFKSIFRSSPKKSEKDKLQRQASSKKLAKFRTHDIRDRLPVGDRDLPPRRSAGDVESAFGGPAGLGGMQRFASGRKSESWASIIEVA
ncbi:hypothetical protein K2173_012140 [Erythroxylum novogranatense]|uniref:Uncharacterized protein n=1 Tax=Erythroxylum novogranatense TaxID=1862640 RepID=A0AAV8SR55_9ROSI|nr:hypothetical protein K2173_012140 [Erythroxylum novogranatense]